MSGTVVVVGSANADIVHLVERIPRPGETVQSIGVSIHPGGKGLNQATAASRAGGRSVLIAAVGEDRNAEMLRRAASDAGVDVTRLRKVSAPTGVAVIAVDPAGENTIIVQSGANGLLAELATEDIAAIQSAAVVLCQLEVPIDLVEQVARLTSNGIQTLILNPSPVRELPSGLLSRVDILVVNEHEAQRLEVETLDLPCVIITRGSAGAEIRRSGKLAIAIPARPAKVVDSTGAGDTFAGVLATEIARGTDIEHAVTRAIVAASLSVEREGAVPSMPSQSEIDDATDRLAVTN